MGSVDRISELPPNVTNRILQFVTLKDAARTSILSTEWRYKWTLSPKLILDATFFRCLIDYFDYEQRLCQYCWLDARIHKFSNIVNNVLFGRDGPIHEFLLYIPSWFPYEKHITHWLRFLSSKSLHVFSLENFSTKRRKLPSLMFSCVGFANLTQLTLINWIVPSLSITCCGFPCLIKLKMDTSEANTIGVLVSKCPLLKELRLNINDENARLDIQASRLVLLILHGQLSEVVLKETQRITLLHLQCKLEHKWGQTMEIFIRCFPLLVNLCIDCDHYLAVQALDMSIVRDCCFEHLESAHIIVRSNGIALELIKLILSSSPVLKVMTIQAFMGAEERFNVAKELLRYRHTTTAEIIFKT